MKSAQNRNIKANTLYLPDWSALRVESGTASQSTLQQVLNSTGIQTSNSSLYHGGSSSDELYYNTSENMSTNQLYTPFNVGTVTNYQRRLASYDDLPLSHMPSTNGSTLTPGLYHRAVAVNSTVAPTSSHVVSDKFHLRRVPYFSEVQDMLKDIVVHDSSGNAFYEITTTGGVNLEKYTQFPSNSGKYRRQLAFKDETQGITKGTDGLLYYNTPGIAESRIPFYNDIGLHPSITPLTQNRVTFENSNLYHDATIKHTEKHLPSGFSTFRRRIAYHDEIPASTGSTGGGSGTNELTYDSIAGTLTHGVANKRIPFYEDIAAHPSSVFHNSVNSNEIYYNTSQGIGTNPFYTINAGVTNFKKRRLASYDDLPLSHMKGSTTLADGLYHRAVAVDTTAPTTSHIPNGNFHLRRVPYFSEVQDMLKDIVVHDSLGNVFYEVTGESGFANYIPSGSGKYRRQLAFKDEILDELTYIGATSTTGATLKHKTANKLVAFYDDIPQHSSITALTTSVSGFQRNVVQGALQGTAPQFRNDALKLGNEDASTVSLGGFNIKVERDDSRTEVSTKLVISSNDTRDRNPITEITQWISANKYNLFEFPYTIFKDSANSNALPKEISSSYQPRLNYKALKQYDSITYSFGINPVKNLSKYMGIYSMNATSYNSLGFYMIDKTINFTNYTDGDTANPPSSSDTYYLFPYYGLQNRETGPSFHYYLRDKRLNKTDSNGTITGWTGTDTDWDIMGGIKIHKGVMNNCTIRIDHLLGPPSETIQFQTTNTDYTLTKFPTNLYPSGSSTAKVDISQNMVEIENISSSGVTSILTNTQFKLSYTPATAAVILNLTDAALGGVFKVKYKQPDPGSSPKDVPSLNYVKIKMTNDQNTEEKIMYLFTNGGWESGKFIPDDNAMTSSFGGQATTYINNFKGDMSHFNIYVEDENPANTHPSIVFYQRPKKTMASDGKTVLEKYDIEFFGDVKFQSNVFLGNKNVADAIDAIAYSSNNAEGRTGESTTTSNEAVVLNDNTAIRHLPSSVI